MRTSRARPPIPTFALYGEAPQPGDELLHIEGIQARSRRYGWEIDAHLHHGLYQVVWVGQGPAQVTLDGVRRGCHGPAAVIVPPGVAHAFQFSADTEGHVLTLSPRSFVEGEPGGTGDALQQLFLAPRIVDVPPDEPESERLERLFDELSAEFHSPETAGTAVPQWLARAVIWRLARVCAREAQADQARARRHHALFTRFVLLVEAHHAEHWPVARYADRLGLSPARLNRLTRAETGRSALELVHDRLLREACRRLIYIAAPVANLALELGFEDASYFTRFFKRMTGTTPQRFRAAHAGGGD